MKKTDFSSDKINESLRDGEYYIWVAHFQDGTSSKVRATDSTTTQAIEKHFGKPVSKIDYSFGIQSGGGRPDPADVANYHREQDRIEARARGANDPQEESIVQEADETPKPGDQIRTKKMQMTGVVEKIAQNRAGYEEVFFRTQDDRLMKTPVSNVTVIEKIIDDEMGEAVNVKGYPDVDHMPGKVQKPMQSNQTVRYFYNEWKELADRANAEQHSNGLIVSSGPETVIYQGDDGTIYAQWNKQKKVGFVKGKTTEGSMGGINRSAPAQDVSYEKVLDEVMAMWAEEQSVNELSVGKLNQYRDASANPSNVNRMPLRKLAKHTDGYNKATARVNTKTGVAKPQYPDRGTYESRLAEFLDLGEDFNKILQKQHKDTQAATKAPVKDIPYHGWTIRYRPAPKTGGTVPWQVMDKKGEIKHKGEATTDRDAVGDAEEWINAGGGTKSEASKNVTIDFNVDFAKEFTPDGGQLYVSFDKNGNTPYIILSTEPMPGGKKTHIRNQKHKMTATTTGLPAVTLSPKESNEVGLQPNGRYLLGDKDPIDDNTAMFPLIYQSTVQGSGDMVKLGKPGLTVAHNRDVDEAITPWGGYTADDKKANALAKAPKSSMSGSTDVPFSTMVQDTIKEHGLKWAFNYYVIKNGLPPRHFKIYAGL